MLFCFSSTFFFELCKVPAFVIEKKNKKKERSETREEEEEKKKEEWEAVWCRKKKGTVPERPLCILFFIVDRCSTGRRKKKEKEDVKHGASEKLHSAVHTYTHTHVFFCPVGSSFARLALLFLFLLVFEALLTFCVTTYTLKRVAQAGGVGREVAFSEV